MKVSDGGESGDRCPLGGRILGLPMDHPLAHDVVNIVFGGFGGVAGYCPRRLDDIRGAVLAEADRLAFAVDDHSCVTDLAL